MLQYRKETPPIKKYWDLFETTGWNLEYQATPDELARAIANSWYLVAVYDEDRLVGFGRVVSDGVLHAMIYDLIVAPDYQGRGIGTQVLNMLIPQCLEYNIRDIQLFCARGKRHFYEKFGFVARPEEAPGMHYRRVQAQQV